MASLTVSNILTRARNRYNATDDNFYSDSELYDLLFDAQSILAKEGWVIEKTYTTPSIVGTRSYLYPVTTLAIKEVRHDWDKLHKVKLQDDPRTDATEPTGKPTSYALWNNAIYLYPTPDTAGSVDDNNIEQDYIQIRVYKYPDDITSSDDIIEVPEEYKEDLISYMLMWMALKDQNSTLSDRYKIQWDEAVYRAKKQRKKRLRGDRNTRVSDYYFGTDNPTIDEFLL